MKQTELVEVINEKGETLYYKKNNGHKLTIEQLRHNQVNKGINYYLKEIIVEELFEKFTNLYWGEKQNVYFKLNNLFKSLQNKTCLL